MASSFLESLKNAADKGEFNSEAAKKIIEIDNLASQKLSKLGTKDIEDLMKDRLEQAGVKTVTEEEAAIGSAEYDKKMEDIKKQDAVNVQIVALMEIEDMVLASVLDMYTFIDELETKFSKEIEANDPIFTDLTQQIGKIKSKYNSIINN